MSKELLPVVTMNLIVDAIRDHCTVFDSIKVNERQLNKIGDKLYGLNFIAVKIRDGDCARIPRYAFDAPAYQAGDRISTQYRAVSELVRTCDARDVQDTSTYIALDKVRLRLALEIADTAAQGK